MDTLTLIASLLAETARVRIFPDVANLPLRPSAMLAKEAASLDVCQRWLLRAGAGGRGRSSNGEGSAVRPRKGTFGTSAWANQSPVNPSTGPARQPIPHQQCQSALPSPRAPAVQRESELADTPQTTSMELTLKDLSRDLIRREARDIRGQLPLGEVPEAPLAGKDP